MNKIYQLLFIAFVLVVIWFHKGLILGGGEAGIIFYSLPNELSIVSNTWVNKALGNPTGVVIAWYPYFEFFSFLQQAGFSPFILQAILFFTLLSLGFLGMYSLVRTTAKNTTVAFVAALFYNLNLLSLTIVWNRFQYPYMFFYASLPLALFLFRKGLVERNIIYAFLLGILSVFFANAFASVPLLLLFWAVMGSYLLFFVFTTTRSRKNNIWAICFFLVSLGIFILCNLWWLLQLVQTVVSKPYLTSQPFTSSDNYTTFTVLSKNLGHIDYLMRLMHKDFFMWMRGIWGNIYYSFPFIVFSFLPALFVFGSLLIKKKPQEYFYFLAIVLFGIFFAKGNADPFGGLFNFLFTHVSILEVFRNPFEKIGLILPLGYAPLFAYGVYNLYSYFLTNKKRYASTMLVSTVVVTCGVLVWPMWNGWLFTSNEPPANNPNIGDYVKVPKYYEQANRWLNTQSNDFRTIALPLRGEGLTYTWEYGYNGVDPTSSLFTKPFLSLCTGVPYLCSITNEFQIQLLKNPETFWKILPPLYANQVMVRNDLDYKLRSLQAPDDILAKLKNPQTKFSLNKTFDKLSFYSIEPTILQEKISGATSGIFYAHPQGNSFIQSVPYANYKPGDIYMTDTALEKQSYQLANSKQILLQAQPFYSESLDVSEENAELGLPFVRFLPDSKFYFYSRFKEKITKFLAGNNSSRQLVVESDKRIVEIARLIRSNKYSLAQEILLEYKDNLENFMRVPSLVSERDSKSDLLRQKYVLTEVISQLENAAVDKNEYILVDELLNSLLDKLAIKTKYPVDLSTFTSYQIHVPEAGEYKVVLEIADWSKFYTSTELVAVIDGNEAKNFVINGGNEKSQILFTEFFSKGRHQIDIKIPQGINIVDTKEEIVELSTNTFKKIAFPFNQFDPFATYTVSFDYFLNKGNIVQGYITQDTDQVVKGIVQPKKSFVMEKNNYNYEWKKVSDGFTPDQISHNATLHFQLYGTNDCLDHNPGFLSGRCRNTTFIKSFNKESKATLKNVSVTRKMNNNLFLIKEKEMLQTPAPQITYKKINSARYSIRVNNASNPYFLTFLESYDPRWKVRIIHSGGVHEQVPEDKHVLVNSFANSWYIQKTGNYDILLEFSPERLLDVGKLISISSVLVAIVVSGIFFIKRKVDDFK